MKTKDKKKTKKKNKQQPRNHTPEYLRQAFLDKAEPFIDDYIASALGEKEIKGSGVARTAVWELLSDIIKQAGDKSKTDIKSGDISGQVKEVFEKVASGDLSAKQGKEYIALLQAGFEITELPKLLASFEELQSK